MIDDLRLIPKTSTALQIAFLVRNMPDLEKAAELIEDYARCVRAGIKLDKTLKIPTDETGESCGLQVNKGD